LRSKTIDKYAVTKYNIYIIKQQIKHTEVRTMNNTYELGHDIGNEQAIKRCLSDIKEHLEENGYHCDVFGNTFKTDCNYGLISQALKLVRLDYKKFYITLVRE